MKIALTGGSGSIGRVIIPMALAQGHQVVSIDRVQPTADLPANVTFAQAELADYDTLLAAFQGCEAVIHMAAIAAPGHHPDHIVHNNNVVGSYNALRAAAEAGIRRVCQASSVNAIGHAYSRAPRYDYFPIDEAHPTFNEDPYSLSKWICEQQADALVRRYEQMIITSLRFHWVTAQRSLPANAYKGSHEPGKHLWAYTLVEAAASACLLSLTANLTGHEAFFIIAPDTCADAPTLELHQRHFAHIPVRGDLSGRRSFFDSSKAERMLGWKHDRYQ